MGWDIVADAKQYVESLLWDFKQKWYYFHNLDHTLEVFDRATYLCDMEWINWDSKKLVQLASLFHDVGFLYKYDKHEKLWAREVEKFLIEREWFFPQRILFDITLEEYLWEDKDYSNDNIQIIKKLVLVTIPFRKPQNKLEEILKDADIDNFGRKDFFEKWELVRKEIEIIKWVVFTDRQRYLNVYEMMKKFMFYTLTQLWERQFQFHQNKKELIDRIESVTS